MPNNNPQPARRRSLREQLRATANASAADVVGRGFEALDELARQGSAKLARHGVHIDAELIESGSFKLKKFLAETISGRKIE